MSRSPRLRALSFVLVSATMSCEVAEDGLDRLTPPGNETVENPTVGTPAAKPTAPIVAVPRDRVSGVVIPTDRVLLPDNRPSFASGEPTTEAVPANTPMENLILLLKGDEEQARALEALIEDQHNPLSARFQQWLSPEDFAAQYAVSANDIAKVRAWLESQGLRVEEIVRNGRAIVFSGEVSTVEAAFHTSMRMFDVDGEAHIANATIPEIPRALEPVVAGVVAMSDFHSRPASISEVQPSPDPDNSWSANGSLQARIAPQDLAIIYNITPVYAAGIDGAGQSIAVLGRSNIDIGNVRTFRSYFGLPANDPQIVLAGRDPGIVCGGDEAEAYLDVEWAGAVAKKATIKFVLAGSSLTTDGIYLAAQYAVTNNVAPVISLSFGLCERLLGSTANSFLNLLWQQAAAQGQSVLVSSMDSGAAGCDAMNAATATGGLGVNGLGSTIYNTAVGGTQFDDVFNRATYWSASNDPTTKASALGYIPETAWNESRGGGLFATGGGVSTLYPKPAWQFGLGVPADGKRDVPDLSFVAAIQEPYLMYADNQWMGSGGTSASTPVFAGVLALVMQKTGARTLGNVNPVLYALFDAQKVRAGAAVFHDTAKGNNTVPGVTGYPSVVGYDLATGLGSADVNQLVNHWGEGATLPAVQVASAISDVSVIPGFTAALGVSARLKNGQTGDIVFSTGALPTGVTAVFSPAKVTNTGSATLTLTAAANAVPGTYNMNVIGTASAGTATIVVPLTVVNQPSLTLAASPAYIDVAAGASGSTTLTTTRSASFNSAVSFAITGLPSGATAKFTPTSIAKPGAGSTTLQVTLPRTTAGGTYAATVSATGGGVTKTLLMAINALPAPDFSLQLSASSMQVAQGGYGTVYATTIRTISFDSAITVKITGMPTGVTVSQGSIAKPGSGVATLGITVGPAVAGGKYNLTVTATGGGVTKTAALALQVPAPAFTASVTSLSVARGKTATMKITSSMLGGFSSAVTFSVSGLPTGVTGSFTPAALPSPGSGQTTLTLTAAKTATTGRSTITVTATAGSVVKTIQIPLTVS